MLWVQIGDKQMNQIAQDNVNDTQVINHFPGAHVQLFSRIMRCVIDVDVINRT